jgi:hypothetical protein
MLLLFIFIISQAPKLELPKVTIYGERGEKIALKGELIPDTIPDYEIPGGKRYTLSTRKLTIYEPSILKKSILYGMGEIGSSGRASLFYGRARYSISGSWLGNIREKKNDYRVKLGFPYINIEYNKRRYKKSVDVPERDYSRINSSFIYYHPSISLSGNISSHSLDKREENLVRIKGWLDYYLFQLRGSMGGVADSFWLSSLRISKLLKLRGINIEPGVSLFIPKKIYPYLRMNTGLFSLEYNPEIEIISMDRLLSLNPFIKEKGSFTYDSKNRICLGVNYRFFKINGGFIENQWTFGKPDSGYPVIDTSIYFLESIFDWRGLSLKARYNYGESSYMPIFKFSVSYKKEFRNFDFSSNFEWIKRKNPKGYYILNSSFGWWVLPNVSIFLDDRLLKKDTEIWDGYYENGALHIGVKYKVP